MKIHIVQKGDTLWKIAKKYGVNFEELKKMNSQLSNPDMIMPGMKIKVPTTGFPVQKEAPVNHLPIKEAPIAVHPYAEIPPITLPVVEEVKEKPTVLLPVKEMPVKEVPKIEMPKPPHIPMPPIYHPQQEIDVNNYYMVNMAMMNQGPQLPPKPAHVLPGIMKPEEESLESMESPEMESPKMPPIYHQPYIPPVYHQPYLPLCPPPPCCVPISPILPGSGFQYPFQPYGYPQMVSPTMMPSMPFVPGMGSPEDFESSPESPDFSFPPNPTGVSPTGAYSQMAAPYGYPQTGINPQMAAPDGYPQTGVNPQMAAPYGYPQTGVSPQMAAPYGYSQTGINPQMATPYGYQPFYGDPQMSGLPGEGETEAESQTGRMSNEVPPYSQATGYRPVAPQWQYQQPPYQQSYMPLSYGAPYPINSAQPTNSPYPYDFQRQYYPFYGMPEYDENDDIDY